MNPESPTPREQLEARLTALLLGELSADEAAELREIIARDAQLAALHGRLKQTIDLVHEAALDPAELPIERPAPVRLGEERRQKLLAQFKTVRPKQFAPKRPPRDPWVFALQAAAVVALLVCLSGLLLPALARSKAKAQRASALASIRQEELARDLKQKQSSESLASKENETAPQPNSGEPAPAAPPTPAPIPVSDANSTPLTGTIVLPSQTTPVELVATATDKKTVPQLRDNYGLAPAGQNKGLKPQSENKKEQTSQNESNGQVPVLAFDNSFKSDAASKDGVDARKTGNWALADGSVQKGSTGTSHVYDEKPVEISPQQTVVFANDLGRPFTQAELNGIASSAAPQAAAAPPPSPGAGGPTVHFANGVGGGSTVYFQNSAGGGFGGAGGRGLPGSDNAGKLAISSRQQAAGAAGPKAESTPQLATYDAGEQSAVVFANPQNALQAAKDQAGQNPLMSRAQTVQQNMRSAQTAPAVDREARSLDYLSNGRSGAAAAVSNSGTVTPGYDLETHQLVVITESGRSATNLVAQMDSSADKSPPVMLMQLARPTNIPPAASEDQPLPKAAPSPQQPQPEVLVSENAFSTFSLNVSDVSFKLAAASLERGVMPDAASIRSEEFINAFDYRDPDPAPGAPIGFAWERVHDPFAHNRDLLRFSVKTAAAGREQGRPLNLVLLLDNSGSMERADRVAIIHEALRVLAAQLQSGDTISVVTFARTARLWVDGIPGMQAGQVLEKVGGLTPEGGTDLGDALDLAYATAHRHYLMNGVNRVVLLTDGAANLGNVDPTALKATVEAQRKQGIELDCFGIGWEGYNDDLLEVLTRNGDGRYGFINTPEEAASGFAAQLAGALHVAASDVKVQMEFNPTRVVSYRQIGYAKHQLTKEQFRDNSVNAAQIGAAEAGNALYTVEVNPQGTGPICTVHVRYRDPGTADYYEHAWDVPYTGSAVALDQASPAMRLAVTASAFSEWLASSPYAAEVSPDALLDYLRGVPAVYGADTRPAQLETMIREAKSLTGK
jgi:Mg-chelatase subunit ChlD/anti-sigma factor RsiW